MAPERMSSFSSSFSTPSSTPQSARPYNFKDSSSLYLITFLATLFLLLFISSALVLRSFIVRRRYQRHIDAAFAAGLVLAPYAPGSRRHRYGHKPKMHTSYVKSISGEGAKSNKWKDMMPISVLPVQAKRRCKSKRNERNLPKPPLWQRHDHFIQPPSAQANTKLVDRLQVSVLIAMPRPRMPSNPSRSSIDKSSISDQDQHLIPNVVFGVTRIPYKHQSNQTP